MSTTITFKITGTKETSDALKNISKELKDLSIPLDDSSRSYLNAISTNFKDEGKTFGQPWPPLSPATIAIKRQLRKEGKSIGVKKPLLRTGLLRRSFGFDLKSKTRSDIYNNTDYAIIHQEGGVSTFKGRKVKIPKRVLADIDTKRIEMVSKIFENWIIGLIKKQGAD